MVRLFLVATMCGACGSHAPPREPARSLPATAPAVEANPTRGDEPTPAAPESVAVDAKWWCYEMEAPDFSGSCSKTRAECVEHRRQVIATAGGAAKECAPAAAAVCITIRHAGQELPQCLPTMADCRASQDLVRGLLDTSLVRECEIAPVAAEIADVFNWWCSTDEVGQGIGLCIRQKTACEATRRLRATKSGVPFSECTSMQRAACFKVHRPLHNRVDLHCLPSFATCKQARKFALTLDPDDSVVKTECTATD